jgi:hypothetical protein
MAAKPVTSAAFAALALLFGESVDSGSSPLSLKYKTNSKINYKIFA